jgi:uncharacterized membrane-anchored protein
MFCKLTGIPFGDFITKGISGGGRQSKRYFGTVFFIVVK